MGRVTTAQTDFRGQVVQRIDIQFLKVCRTRQRHHPKGFLDGAINSQLVAPFLFTASKDFSGENFPEN
jgi:hypothetical protein